MKVVINTCFGGFGLSKEAYEFLGRRWDGYGFDFKVDRTNPDLIRVVETLGKKADGMCAKLKVVEIPDGIRYTIEDYDGAEHIAEEHKTWY